MNLESGNYSTFGQALQAKLNYTIALVRAGHLDHLLGMSEAFAKVQERCDELQRQERISKAIAGCSVQ